MRALQPFAVRYALVALLVVLVTALHYNTSMHIHAAHGIYRRLYYFPIILAAFRGGSRAGLLTALAVIVAYLPHAMGYIGHDPGSGLEKFLETALYVAVGLVCGILVDREKRTQNRLAETLDEKSRMEGELIRQARMATVGRLSAGLAHEIRNPLASIKGAAEIVADGVDAADPRRRMLDIVKTEAVRLNEVLTRFLAFARPSARDSGSVDLAAEARDVVELTAQRDGAGRIEAPAANARVLVEGDREQIRQLLTNLVLNGVQAAGPDGQVTVEVIDRGALARLVVSDDGPGFAPESLENFGTPFFSTKEGGTGLGLAVCHRIVEDHGGVLYVDEHAVRGARVIVDLPRTGGEVA